MGPFEEAQKAAMATLQRDLLAQLNRQLWTDTQPRVVLPPMTRWRRFKRRLQAIQDYCTNVWRTLKGQDCYDEDY